jgi:hypothetical protein
MTQCELLRAGFWETVAFAGELKGGTVGPTRLTDVCSKLLRLGRGTQTPYRFQSRNHGFSAYI